MRSELIHIQGLRRTLSKHAFRAALAVTILACFSGMSPRAGFASPPDAANGFPSTRAESIVDTIFGQRVADPYRWLESSTSDEVKTWVGAQSSYTRSVLDSLPYRDKISRRLGELLSIGSLGVPEAKGNHYFFTERQGTENQPVLYVRDGLKGKPLALVNPNTYSSAGTVALDWWYPSEDGKLLAYGISNDGNELSTLYVMQVDGGKALTDTIPGTRACSLAWTPDGKGFYYTRYPQPGDVPKGEEVFHRSVYYHRLGADPGNDKLIFGNGRDMEDWPEVGLSPGGRYLLVTEYVGAVKTEMYLNDLQSTSGFIPIVEGVDAIFEGKILDDSLYIKTNEDAPNYKIMGIDLKQPSRNNWSQIVPESQAAIEWFTVIGNKLFAGYLENAFSRVRLFSLGGTPIREIEFPVPGYADLASGDPGDSEAFIGFQSYFVPHTIYRFDISGNSLDLYDKVETSIDTSPYRLDQVFFPSKDGTRVSMFIVRRKDMDMNSDNPAILYGYGGFNVSTTPYFTKNMFFWIENGGVYAEVNLRGGAEYGENWHRAGMLGNKQNVFDDFIAAAEWLCRNKYTNPSKLAIMGGSNGGLLVAATLTQRPELFRVAVSMVPLTDMVRYHLFSLARYWIGEYGSPEDSTAFKWLYAYSPYHHVKDGEAYPAVLLTTAESDSRVDSMHAKKMAARLQNATSSGRPVLLRYETNAGHGAGTPLSKSVQLYTDIFSFIVWQMGLKL